MILALTHTEVNISWLMIPALTHTDADILWLTILALIQTDVNISWLMIPALTHADAIYVCGWMCVGGGCVCVGGEGGKMMCLHIKYRKGRQTVHVATIIILFKFCYQCVAHEDNALHLWSHIQKHIMVEHYHG